MLSFSQTTRPLYSDTEEYQGGPHLKWRQLSHLIDCTCLLRQVMISARIGFLLFVFSLRLQKCSPLVGLQGPFLV